MRDSRFTPWLAEAVTQADLLSELSDTPVVIHDVGDARICTYYRAESVS